MRHYVTVESATHDDVKAGNTATLLSRVAVEADTPTEATLLAAQIVGCRRMPTRTTLDHPQR